MGPDLQCSWQVLLQCAGPRCNHFDSATMIQECSKQWKGGSLDVTQVAMARHITTLPMRMGGLGLRSAVRTAAGVCWASWADALHMLHRLPHLNGAHDSPRTPNVHISGPRRFKHHQNSTKEPQERERRKKIVGEGKKSAKFWAPHPSGLTLLAFTLQAFTLRGPPFGAPPFGAPPSFVPKIQHPKIGRKQIGRWLKSKLAEVELAELKRKSWPWS